MKIYTRSGDSGQASLYNGERLFKDDAVFAALGDVDELNSALGVAASHIGPKGGDAELMAQLVKQIQAIQSRLIDVGSAVATPLPTSSEAKLQRTHFAGAQHTKELEEWIDAMDVRLPPLHNFILPAGGCTAAAMHHARSVCRRAERSIVVLARRETISGEVTMYVNRLSDYLFTAARYTASLEGSEEVVYKKAD